MHIQAILVWGCVPLCMFSLVEPLSTELWSTLDKEVLVVNSGLEKTEILQ